MAKNAMLSVDSVKRKNVYFVDDLPSTANLGKFKRKPKTFVP